ncbi:hypothetical protein [Butyricicoccus porcorum]|uniref:hypothetical protein n=1 Tax=Butyricicoccus porcorum TaxID=1945634 RepID=UPI003F4A98ED
MKATQDATRQKVAELRHMAGRTGNHNAETTMREAASYMEDLNIALISAMTEADKLREKNADLLEQLSGWKALVDSMKSAQSVQLVEPEAESVTVPAQSPKRSAPFDYTGELARFIASGESVHAVSVLRHYDAGGYTPNASRFNAISKKRNFPVAAFYHPEKDAVILVRTSAGDAK